MSHSIILCRRESDFKLIAAKAIFWSTRGVLDSRGTREHTDTPQRERRGPRDAHHSLKEKEGDESG